MRGDMDNSFGEPSTMMAHHGYASQVSPKPKYVTEFINAAGTRSTAHQSVLLGGTASRICTYGVYMVPYTSKYRIVFRKMTPQRPMGFPPIRKFHPKKLRAPNGFLSTSSTIVFALLGQCPAKTSTAQGDCASQHMKQENPTQDIEQGSYAFSCFRGVFVVIQNWCTSRRVEGSAACHTTQVHFASTLVPLQKYGI